MGKVKEGMFGSFIGKVGKLIGGKWRGIDYVKTKGSPRNPDTDAQRQQRAKFAIAVQFARRMSKLFKITYKIYAKQMTARNNALVGILKEAITGAYPNYEIDYPKVMISKGGLPNGEAPTVSSAGGIITWTWIDNTGVDMSEKTDRSIVVAYCPERRQCLYKLQGSSRDEEMATMDATLFVGKTVVTWLSFISEDGDKIADSVFTGQIVVS